MIFFASKVISLTGSGIDDARNLSFGPGILLITSGQLSRGLGESDTPPETLSLQARFWRGVRLSRVGPRVLREDDRGGFLATAWVCLSGLLRRAAVARGRTSGGRCMGFCGLLPRGRCWTGWRWAGGQGTRRGVFYMYQVREHAGLARGPLSSVGAALFAPRNTRPRTARATAPRSTVRLHALACVLRWSPALPLYSRVVVNLHLCSAAAPPSERVDLERGVGAQAHPGTKQELRVDRGRPRASQVHRKFIRHLDCAARGFCGRASGLPGDVCFFRTNCSAIKKALARGHFASPACSRARNK